jgi:hypothetical protein
MEKLPKVWFNTGLQQGDKACLRLYPKRIIFEIRLRLVDFDSKSPCGKPRPLCLTLKIRKKDEQN